MLPDAATMFTRLRFNNSEQMLPRVDESKKKKTSEAGNEEGGNDDGEDEGEHEGGSGGGGPGDDDESDQGDGESALQDKGSESENVSGDTTVAWSQWTPKEQEMFQRFFMVLIPKVRLFGYSVLSRVISHFMSHVSCRLFLLPDQSAME